MMILHISKRRIAVMAVSFMVIAAVTVVLAGCFSDKENTITLADTAEMADYLQQLGWQVEPDPIETLDLQLPQSLGDTWGDYAAMQTEQGLPFADFAGQPIRRYTFRITNYPGMDGGVQANLYLCGDTLIGGDVVATGKGRLPARTDISRGIDRKSEYILTYLVRIIQIVFEHWQKRGSLTASSF